MANNNRSGRIFAGIFLILCGVLLLLLTTGAFDYRISVLWPLFILVPGLFFAAMAFSSRSTRGAIFPATFFTLLGLLFLLWSNRIIDGFHLTWPAFPGILGLCFVMLYIFEPEGGLLFPAFILLAVSAVGFGINYRLIGPDAWKWWPVVLVAIGAWLIMRTFFDFGSKKKYDDGPKGNVDDHDRNPG
ncbi:MAG TPA: hypothetical protein DCL69_03525 [Firmicutes bacterium]|nr:hypothetical protein [Bacillota bacterium]